jgi:hypothetical protein
MASILSDILDPLTGASDAAAAQTQAAELSAGAITESTEAQIDFQTWLWGEQQELAQPFVDVGVGALPGLTEAISEPFTAEQMMEDPGYQFRLEEGLKGVEASGAAKGMQLSGRTLKGIGRYAQDYASGEFGKAYERRQQGISNLMNLAIMGQSAAAGQSAAGGVMGGNVTAAMSTAGAAEAGMHSDIGNFQAAQAQSGWNTMMDVAGVAAMTYGGPGWGAPAAGG